MEGGFGVITHELIELLIRLAFDTGADFAATILIQRLLMHDPRVMRIASRNSCQSCSCDM